MSDESMNLRRLSVVAWVRRVTTKVLRTWTSLCLAIVSRCSLAYIGASYVHVLCRVWTRGAVPLSFSKPDARLKRKRVRIRVLII